MRRRVQRKHGQVGMAFHLVPRNHGSGTVAAKHRIGGVGGVAVSLIADLGGHGLGIGAGLIPGGAGVPAAQPAGVGRHLTAIVLQGAHGAAARKAGSISQSFGGLKLCAHALQIVHGAAHLLGGHLQRKLIHRLQQHRLCLAQALPHGAVGGLTKIAALGVLGVGAPCHQRDLDIGDGRARQAAEMLFFFQMC